MRSARFIGSQRIGVYSVFNVVDDEPAPAREWLPVYAELLRGPRPLRVPRLIGRLGAGSYGIYLMCEQNGADNAKARRELAWTPRHSSWRTGFAQLLAH